MRKNARSSTLKAKLQRLEEPSRRATNEPDSEAVRHEIHDSNLHNTISAKIWQLIQRGVFDANAARRLKPLRPIDATPLGAEHADDEIFADESAFCSEIDLEHMFEDADDDILFEPPEEEYDYDSDDELLWDALEDEIDQPTHSQDQLLFGSNEEYDLELDGTQVLLDSQLAHDHANLRGSPPNIPQLLAATHDGATHEEISETNGDEMILEF